LVGGVVANEVGCGAGFLADGIVEEDLFVLFGGEDGFVN
jgi:hypothetical protein